MGFLQNVNMLEPYQKVQTIKTNEIQQAVDTMKLEEMREEKKKLDIPIPFDMFKKQLSDRHGEDVANAMGERVRKMGWVDETPGADKQPILSIKMRNIKAFSDYLNYTPEDAFEFIGMELQSLEREGDELQKALGKTTKEEDKENIMQAIKDNEQKQIKVLEKAEGNKKKYEKKQQILNAKRVIGETERDPNVKKVMDDLKLQARSGDKNAGFILMQYTGARNHFLQGDISAKDFNEGLRHIIEKVIGKEGKSVIQSDKIQGVMAELGIDPNNPANYTTENIAKTSAELRKREQEGKKELIELRQGEIGEREDERRRTRIIEQFNNDPAVRKTEQIDQFSQLIIDVANSDNPVGHASLATLMARSSGEVGNLSEADKKPFGGSRSLEAKTKQVFTEIYSGKKTPENLKFVSDLASTFQKAGLRKKRELAKLRAKQYKSALRGKISEDDIYEMLAPMGIEEQSTAGNLTPQQQNRLEELRSKDRRKRVGQ